jgi:U2-associated protein SR140
LRQLLLGEATLQDLAEAKAAKGIKSSEVKVEAEKRDPEIGETKGFKTSGFKSSFKRVLDPATEAENMLNEVLGTKADQGKEDTDLDGEEMDIDGEEMDPDLDGEPMDDDDDDDLDGEPM